MALFGHKYQGIKKINICFTVSIFSAGEWPPKDPSFSFSWTGELILLISEAVPGIGSSSSESGSGVGLMSSKPVLDGREFC